jgi:hypothetical protein
MDAEEFLKQVNPAVRRSKLAPHLEDIRKLRGSGCTLEQVCAFLASNGVTVSVAGLSSYLLRQEKLTNPVPKEKQKTQLPAQPAIKPEASKPQPEETKPPQQKTGPLANLQIDKPARFKHNPTPDKDLLG